MELDDDTDDVVTPFYLVVDPGQFNTWAESVLIRLIVSIAIFNELRIVNTGYSGLLMMRLFKKRSTGSNAGLTRSCRRASAGCWLCLS